MIRKIGDEGFERNVRAKTCEPSKVLHARHLPPNTTETELLQVVAPYGQVAKILVLNQKTQAFVEMASQEAANAALAALEVTSPSIRGSQLYFQYSTRTSVEAGAAQGQAGEHKGEAA